MTPSEKQIIYKACELIATVPGIACCEALMEGRKGYYLRKSFGEFD